jgi:hypothetical protein
MNDRVTEKASELEKDAQQMLEKTAFEYGEPLGNTLVDLERHNRLNAVVLQMSRDQSIVHTQPIYDKTGALRELVITPLHPETAKVPNLVVTFIPGQGKDGKIIKNQRLIETTIGADQATVNRLLHPESK